MQWWDVVGAVVCLIVGGLFALLGLALWRAARTGQTQAGSYAEEERRWQALRDAGIRSTAEILRLSRPVDRLTLRGDSALKVAAADLMLRYADRAGTSREAVVPTFIDVELLAGFEAGREIGIVYAADAPDVVAIDRDRTPLEIPSTPAR